MILLYGNESPPEVADPNATASSMLDTIPKPKRARFLEDTAMAIVYIVPASVIVLSPMVLVAQSSTASGSRGSSICKITQKHKFCQPLLTALGSSLPTDP